MLTQYPDRILAHRCYIKCWYHRNSLRTVQHISRTSQCCTCSEDSHPQYEPSVSFLWDYYNSVRYTLLTLLLSHGLTICIYPREGKYWREKIECFFHPIILVVKIAVYIKIWVLHILTFKNSQVAELNLPGKIQSSRVVHNNNTCIHYMPIVFTIR